MDYLSSATVPSQQIQSNLPSISLFSGASSQTYQIKVPPGTNNLQSNIFLSYNSHSTNQKPSITGAGWNLNQNYILRNTNHTANDLSDDEFILVLNNAQYDLLHISGNSFNTVIESYLNIENKTNGNNTNSEYWIVRTKDGTSYRFGHNPDSEAISNQYDFTWKWSLDLVNDTYGNSIYFTYRENPSIDDLGAVYPHKILYNNDQKREIEFILEPNNRSKLWESYEQGNRIKEHKRIKEIVVNTENKLVRRYVLEYENRESKSFISNISHFSENNVTSFSPTQFNYYQEVEGWYQENSWEPPACLAGNAGGDRGYRPVDFNRDGLVDLLQGWAGAGCSSDNWNAWVNNGTGLQEDDSWEPPDCFTAADGSDKGLRIADVNNDGFPDLLKGLDSETPSCGDAEKTAWIHNGNGWTQDDSWEPPICFTGNSTDKGVRLVDINGDGRIDILRGLEDESNGCQTEERQAWLNNGTGWQEDDSWEPPFCYVGDGGVDKGYRLTDFNGDGLIDFLQGWASGGSCFDASRTAWINNGTGWVQDDSWEPPGCFKGEDGVDQGYRLTDANGDGLVDVLQGVQATGGACNDGQKTAWINNGTGWIQDDRYEPPECFLGEDLADLGHRLVDINGDGLSDFLQGAVDGESNCAVDRRTAWINNGTKPNLLKSTNNSLGGNTVVDYISSAKLDHEGTDSLSDLGFNLWVVANTTENNGIMGDHNVISFTIYTYSNGSYDYDTQEFRGFGFSEEGKENSIVEHHFHQDFSKKGREFRTKTLDNSDNLYSMQEFIWNNRTENGYYIVELIESSDHSFDTSPTARIKNTTFDYDDFGNTIAVSSYGATDLTGDERFEYFEFANNSNLWIVDKLNHYKLLDFDNSTILISSNFTYDNSEIPDKGSLTSQLSYLDSDEDVSNNFTYDSFGNVLTQTDPLGNVIIYSYDSTGTLTIRITDADNRITLFNYDLATGNLLSETDTNGVVTNNSYDEFGRISNTTLPLDDVDLPSIIYVYDFDGTAPEEVKASVREDYGSSNTYDTFSFYDGFNRIIQTKSEGTNNRQIVLNTYYDSFGRVDKTSNPYFITLTEDYSTPNSSISFVNITYDILNRIIETINPDSTSNSITYNRWNLTLTDENGNVLDNSQDAYGNIIEIKENNGGIYITTYTYDPSNNLLTIKDNLDNTWNYTYDSLNRKITSQDPDTGLTNYSYDSVGNLISQVSGSGNLITEDDFYREYNELGQLIRIRTGNEPNSTILEDYEYDPNGDRIKTHNHQTNTTTYTPFKEFTMIVNSTGIFNYTYIYENDVLVAKINYDGSKRYYHPDHLGSTTLITDENGNLIEETSYLPYGSVGSGGLSENKLYENKELDGSGQYYYESRYYDPSKKIFIQPDSLIPNIQDPQQLNIYAFERGNPYKYVDPNGEAPESRNEIGTYHQFKNFLENKYKDSDSTNTQIISNLAEYYAEYNPAIQANVEGVPRYLSVKGGEVIDFKHYFASAELTSQTGSLGSMSSGYLIELGQRVEGDSSGFSPEDLPSNKYGRQIIGSSRFIPKFRNTFKAFNALRGSYDRNDLDIKENKYFNSRGNAIEIILEQLKELDSGDPTSYKYYYDLPYRYEGGSPPDKDKKYGSS